MDRRDGAARIANASEANRFSDAVFSASAIDHLRSDVEGLRAALAAAASPEVLRDVDRAMGVLSRQVRDARTDARRAEQAGSSLAESVAERLDGLRDSIESLRAAEPTVALAAAVEAMSRKLEVIDAKAIDPVAVARLQLQTAELKDLVGRTLAHAAAAAEQVRQEAAEQLAAVGAGALEAVTAASADFGRKAAETLTRIEDRLEQHLAAQAAPQAAPSPDAEALAALRDRLDQLAHDVQALAPATDGRLAAQVERLLERIDQGGGIEAATLAPLVSVLERHLVTLTERMGESQVRLQRLDGIELLLQRMTGDMQRMRHELAEETDAAAEVVVAPAGLAADWALPAEAEPQDPAFATLDEAGELFRTMHVPAVAADVAARDIDPAPLDAEDPRSDEFWQQVLGPAFLEAAQSLPADTTPEAAAPIRADAPQPLRQAEPAAPVSPDWQRRDRAGLPSLAAAKRRPDSRSPEVAPARRDDQAPPLAPELTGLTRYSEDFAPAPALRTLAPPQAEPAMAAGADLTRADAAAQPQADWPAHDAVAVWVVPEAHKRPAAEAPKSPRPRPVAPAVAGERLSHDERKPRQKPISARDAAALEAALTAAPAEDEAPRVRLDYVAAADRAEHREKGARVARKRRSERRIHTALRLGGVAAAILILGLVTVKLTAREGVAGLQSLVSAPLATDGSGPAPVDKTLLTKLPPPVGPAALKTAALAGDADAAGEVGMRYADGKGTDVDTAAAMKWLGFAAAHGSVPAAYKLGSLYEFSTRNVTEARRLYQWAAERGNLRAMHSVGVLYSDGVDGKPDWINATNWFRKAAELGLRDSQYNLGVIYGRGLAGAVDRAEAWKWFSLAAKQGDTDSARKRDDVANKADPGVVDRAKAAAAAFVPGPVVEAANSVPVKPEWEVAAPADAAPRKSASRS